MRSGPPVRTGNDAGERVLRAKLHPVAAGHANHATFKFDLARGGAARSDDELPGMTHQVGVVEFNPGAVVAIIISLLVISLYVAFRFAWKFTVPVLIALMHDLLITAGVYALTGRQVTASTVAALLTILGYSSPGFAVVRIWSFFADCFGAVLERGPGLLRGLAGPVHLVGR